MVTMIKMSFIKNAYQFKTNKDQQMNVLLWNKCFFLSNKYTLDKKTNHHLHVPELQNMQKQINDSEQMSPMTL